MGVHCTNVYNFFPFCLFDTDFNTVRFYAIFCTFLLADSFLICFALQLQFAHHNVADGFHLQI
jgi:hypothetical protein